MTGLTTTNSRTWVSLTVTFLDQHPFRCICPRYKGCSWPRIKPMKAPRQPVRDVAHIDGRSRGWANAVQSANVTNCPLTALFFLCAGDFSQSVSQAGGSVHDDTRPARLVRRPQRSQRSTLLGRPRLDTASSAEARFTVRAAVRRTPAAPAESAAVIGGCADPAGVSATATPTSARRLLLGPGAGDRHPHPIASPSVATSSRRWSSNGIRRVGNS
jgi:hypothetical protein